MTARKSKKIALQAALRMWSRELRTLNPYERTDNLLVDITNILDETDRIHPGSIYHAAYEPIFTRPLKLLIMALLLAFLIILSLAIFE